MKYRVTRFKNLKVGLKELEPFIRNGEHLQTGKPFKRFGGMRSREVLANWLLCVVNNFECGAERFTFSSVPPPLHGDGIIYDTKTENSWQTEHVMVPRAHPGETPDINALVLGAIQLKQNKGEAYASGKTLVVFLEAGGGPWFPNKVAKQLPKPDFDTVWVVGLQRADTNGYVYGVANLELDEGIAPAWSVSVDANFDAWDIKRIQ
jgi:hypothetical protein